MREEEIMDRAERRERTEKVAQKRFKEEEEVWNAMSSYPWSPEKESAGFYRKKSPFTFPKVPKREWKKIQKRKRANFKAEKRNGDIETVDTI